MGIAVQAVPLPAEQGRGPSGGGCGRAGRYAVRWSPGTWAAPTIDREIARICGAEAVITTATDLRHAFAVDSQARRQGCVVTEPGKIRVSSRALRRRHPHLFPLACVGDAPGGRAP
ncbi:MAG: hypothetical protein ACLTYN_03830 [Dysosmobacter welbionis]